MHQGDAVDGIVQRAAQVVRDVSDDDTPSAVWMRTAVQDMYRNLRFVDVHLRDESHSVGLLEGLKIPLEFVDVFTCSIEPGLNELS